MRILYLASVRIPSEKASGLAIVRQCEGFAKNGHEVDLLVPRRAKTEVSIEEAYGIKLNFTVHKFSSLSLFQFGKLGLAFLYFYEDLRALWFLLKEKGRYDVIYSRDQYRILPFLCLGFSKKCFTELHTIHGNFLTKFVSKKSRKVIVISKGLQDFYKELSQRNDILVEPSGVYLEQFDGLPSQAEVRKGLSLPLDKVIFGYVGKLTTIGESKGVEEIIEAFSSAHKQKPKTHLLLAGVESHEESAVREIFKSLGTPDSAYTLTPLDQSLFAQYLTSCDVLLMNYPSKEHYVKYMSPIKMFAYLAVGKPIVSSDLPTIREIHDVEGILYARPDSVEDYSKQLLNALNLLQELSLKAQKNIEVAERYSWESRARRILL
ncbi:MAG: hypothetical protein RL538_310 [Candidatus Parcubacteria bacterium]|jgi:glycosyltransferase involved in cell wall biosynthesis